MGSAATKGTEASYTAETTDLDAAHASSRAALTSSVLYAGAEGVTVVVTGAGSGRVHANTPIATAATASTTALPEITHTDFGVRLAGVATGGAG